MGAVASVFEAIAKRCPEPAHGWPHNVNVQHNLVLFTRKAFGLDWRYSIDCTIGNHSDLHITADQSARLRNATVITVPNGNSASFQEKLDFFTSGEASDLAIPGQSPCPYCAENIALHTCALCKQVV